MTFNKSICPLKAEFVARYILSPSQLVKIYLHEKYDSFVSMKKDNPDVQLITYNISVSKIYVKIKLANKNFVDSINKVKKEKKSNL